MTPLLRRDLTGRYPDWRRTVLVCAIAGVLLGSSIGALVRVVAVEGGGAGERRLGAVVLVAVAVALVHVLVVAVDSVRPVPGMLRLLDAAGRLAVWGASLACGIVLLVDPAEASVLGGAVLLVALGGLWWSRGIGRAPAARAEDERLRVRIEAHLRESPRVRELEESVGALSARLGEWELSRRMHPARREPRDGASGVTRTLDRLGPPGRGARRLLDWLGGRGARG